MKTKFISVLLVSIFAVATLAQGTPHRVDSSHEAPEPLERRQSGTGKPNILYILDDNLGYGVQYWPTAAVLDG